MPHLRHLALRCRDMERSRQFYEGLIGWKFIGYRPSGQGLDLSDGVNNITLLQHTPEPRRQLAEGDEFIHFGIVVDDIEAVWKRLREWGAEIARDDVKERNPVDPHTPPRRSFKVLDPDGNVVDITCDRAEWRGVAYP